MPTTISRANDFSRVRKIAILAASGLTRFSTDSTPMTGADSSVSSRRQERVGEDAGRGRTVRQPAKLGQNVQRRIDIVIGCETERLALAAVGVQERNGEVELAGDDIFLRVGIFLHQRVDRLGLML